MNRAKKMILTMIFITIAFIFGMSTKVSALETRTIQLGETRVMTLNYMIASDNVYCIAHSKNLLGLEPAFQAIGYVDIKGKHAEGVVRNSDGSYRWLERNSPENAVIASILAGSLTKGYGKLVNGQPSYNETQKALYGIWNKWVGSVGGQYGFTSDSGNDTIFTQCTDTEGLIKKAEDEARKKDYEVRIYLLHTNSPANPQELILVERKSIPDDSDEPQPGQTTTTGYINISGYVWEDIANSKSNTINSKYEEGDIKLKGIKVHWKDQQGNEISSTETGDDGSYTLSTTIELYNHPYGIKDSTKYDEINNSYIEFEYNGLKYTTVAYNGNLSDADLSRGKENQQKRDELDNKFDKVENRAIYDGNNAIISGLPNTNLTDANYAEEFAVSASTQNIANSLIKIAEDNGWTEKKTFCTDHCQPGEGPHVIYKETYGEAYIKIYCNGTIDIHDPQNHWSNAYKSSMTQKRDQIVGDVINNATGSESHYYSAGETDGPTSRDCRTGESKIYVWNINNMNLGLVKREQPDAAIASDIEKVRVIMKNQEYTYIYGNRGIQNNEELFDYTVKFGNKYVEQQYSRPVNPADIAYVNYNNSDDLKVYVTYNIILKNQSNTLPMTINSIVNYYDSNYTIYTGAGTSTSSGWQEADGTNNGYKIAYNSSLNGTQLQPGSKSEIIKLEFEVNQDRIKGLLNEDATLYNVSEIFSFTTYYGENTMCAEREDAATKNKTGQQYAGIDIDSTPGNATPGNLKENPDTYEKDIKTYEDDTDKAPSFLLMKDPNYKTMSGIVYEDTQTTESREDNERLGNGQKEGTEKGVANVKVELLDAETGEPAYVYYKDSSTESGANKKIAVAYTDENGNYSLGKADESGVIVGNYIIKYTYGNDTTELANGATTIDGSTYINARNYKSTIITDANVKNVMQGNNSNTWYLDMDSSVDTSIAVDDLKERLTINSLKYDNYNEVVNMSAYSKPVEIQIEYTKDQQKNMVADEETNDVGGIAYIGETGETKQLKSDCEVFDFGIMERAREDIVINKTISKMKLTLSNEQILIDGDPRTDNLNYVKAIGLSGNNRDVAEFSALDRMLTIEIDSELIQGATLEVWYSITATNNSEKDYEYENIYNDIDQTTNFITTNSQANYYYYGNKNGLSVITKSAEIVVDYMNPKLACNVGTDSPQNIEGINNNEWFRFDNSGTPIDAEFLKNNGYISYKINDEEEDKTYETIKNRELQTIVTNKFADLAPGDTKTSVIYASGLLANQEENNVYDNHVEIIQINGKIGRTISRVDDTTREQVAKTYQPGDYIPALERTIHQQDDDRVRIVVTPPTGITNYTTIYIITAVVGLIIVIGGVFLIKKKVID